MTTPDRTHIDADEQAFDLEELIYVEETCGSFLSPLKQSREEKYTDTFLFY